MTLTRKEYKNFDKEAFYSFKHKNPQLSYCLDEFYLYDFPSEILPYLFLGNFTFAVVKSSLKIDFILNIGVFFGGIKPIASMQYEKIKDDENEDIYKFFDIFADIIHERITKKEIVYVHCFVGMSRSPTIVASYLMKYHNMTANQALFFIKDKRTISNPNEGFVKQLEKYEQKLS